MFEEPHEPLKRRQSGGVRDTQEEARGQSPEGWRFPPGLSLPPGHLRPEPKLPEPPAAGGPAMSPGDSPGIAQVGEMRRGDGQEKGEERGSAQLGKAGEEGLASCGLPAPAAR